MSIITPPIMHSGLINAPSCRWQARFLPFKAGKANTCVNRRNRAAAQRKSTTSTAPDSVITRKMSKPDWPTVLGVLLSSGATAGTLLDGIHSRVGLQVYDVGPITAGGLHTSLAVPPLLATFYLVLGGLLLWADATLKDDPATQQAQQRAENVFYTAASFGVLALNLAVSAYMYERSYPYWQISAVLAALAAANWKLFDGTKQGVALAAVCALGAPAAELVLLQIWPLWHYARPDVLGFVSWVPWCYFFYTPAVSNLVRCVYVNSTKQEQVR